MSECNLPNGGQHAWIVIDWTTDRAIQIYCPTCGTKLRRMMEINRRDEWEEVQ